MNILRTIYFFPFALNSLSISSSLVFLKKMPMEKLYEYLRILSTVVFDSVPIFEDRVDEAF